MKNEVSKNNTSNKKISIMQIRSKYIVKQIFDNLYKSKVFKIIRYNKTLINKLNKGIKDFKKEHSKIEIEIIPIDYPFGKFININKENELYTHIYFNNDNKEIKLILRM